MFTLTLDSAEFRTLALALAECSRRRVRGDEDGPVSRALARSLSEHVGSVAAKGHVVLGLSDRETRVAREALVAAAGMPMSYGALVNRRPTFRALAARLEA